MNTTNTSSRPRTQSVQRNERGEMERDAFNAHGAARYMVEVARMEIERRSS